MYNKTDICHMVQHNTSGPLVSYTAGYETHHLDIRVQSTRFFFVSSIESTIWVYRNLRPIDAPPFLDRPKPEWSLVITNESETLLLWESANEVVLELVNEETQLVKCYLSLETAQQLSREILECLDNNCSTKQQTYDTEYQPHTIALEFKCDETEYVFTCPRQSQNPYRNHVPEENYYR